ncbi:MAG: hypothetical protein HC933_20650 [Pleurocapsa sp. SU_196_0]|nr:hypothetical protein [Pleurocapsa sp. SU_196_0]
MTVTLESLVAPPLSVAVALKVKLPALKPVTDAEYGAVVSVEINVAPGRT